MQSQLLYCLYLLCNLQCNLVLVMIFSQVYYISEVHCLKLSQFGTLHSRSLLYLTTKPTQYGSRTRFITTFWRCNTSLMGLSNLASPNKLGKWKGNPCCCHILQQHQEITKVVEEELIMSPLIKKYWSSWLCCLFCLIQLMVLM